MGGRGRCRVAARVGRGVACVPAGAGCDGVVVQADAVCRRKVDGGLQGQVGRLSRHELEQEAGLHAQRGDGRRSCNAGLLVLRNEGQAPVVHKGGDRGHNPILC